MNKKEVKVYLNSVKNNDKLISNLKQEIVRLRIRAQSYGNNQSHERVQSSTSNNNATFTKVLELIEEKEQQIQKLIKDREARNVEVINFINSLGNNLQAIILIKYYVHGSTIASIAREINYSVGHTYTMYEQAISELAKRQEV